MFKVGDRIICNNNYGFGPGGPNELQMLGEYFVDEVNMSVGNDVMIKVTNAQTGVKMDRYFYVSRFKKKKDLPHYDKIDKGFYPILMDCTSANIRSDREDSLTRSKKGDSYVDDKFNYIIGKIKDGRIIAYMSMSSEVHYGNMESAEAMLAYANSDSSGYSIIRIDL